MTKRSVWHGARGALHRLAWLVVGAGVACSGSTPTTIPAADGGADAGVEAANLSKCTFEGPSDDFGPRDLGLVPAVSRSADARVFEVDLVAAPMLSEYLVGRKTPAWAFNGSIPGPLIEARVGDRLVVHFTNHLDEPTTIHWHGVHVPADMDGATVTRDPVWPGDSFTYEFPLMQAGLFWYHPHAHESAQIERGLYGALLVRNEAPLSVPERILILQDVLIDGNGILVPDEALLSDPRTGIPSATSVHTQEMMGREGNVMLVNGKAFPTIDVKAGTWERWRIINASTARYYPLKLEGHHFVLIGTDGGLLEAPIEDASILLTPGERVDLLVYFGKGAGRRSLLYADQYGRRRFTGGSRRFNLAQLRYDDTPAPLFAPPLPVPARLRTIEKLDPSASVRPFIFGEQIQSGTVGHDHGGVPTTCAPQIAYPGKYQFTINGELYPDVTPVPAKLGETQTWELINDSWMDHPFHLHGFFFQPLMLGGVAPPLQWKDTINVPHGQSVRVAVRFTDYAGSFLFHCHIVNHGAEGGMMGEVAVTRP